MQPISCQPPFTRLSILSLFAVLCILFPPPSPCLSPSAIPSPFLAWPFDFLQRFPWRWIWPSLGILPSLFNRFLHGTRDLGPFLVGAWVFLNGVKSEVLAEALAVPLVLSSSRARVQDAFLVDHMGCWRAGVIQTLSQTWQQVVAGCLLFKLECLPACECNALCSQTGDSFGRSGGDGGGFLWRWNRGVVKMPLGWCACRVI